MFHRVLVEASCAAGDDLIPGSASVPPPPGRLPPQFRKSVGDPVILFLLRP